MSSNKSKKEAVEEKVKVVIRRLPKHMTEKEVMEQISPLPQEVIGTYFRPANFSFDRSAYATMTLLFSEYCNSLVEFEHRFDGYIFVDSRGNDSSAVVEAAVSQQFAKCDRARMAEDTRVGAILNDKYYVEFCEKLEQEKAIPVMTLEQQIKRLGRPDDARTQISRLETPLVKYFFDKEAGKRQHFESRKIRRDEKKAAKPGKNVLDILMKPSTTRPSSSTSISSAPVFKKELKEPVTEREKEKMAKVEAKRKERDALRKQKFMEEKKRKRAERELLENHQEPRREQVPREQKKKERPGKPPRPTPAKTLSEQQGEDWIKKLTDPKATIKKKHDIPVSAKLTVPKVSAAPKAPTSTVSSIRVPGPSIVAADKPRRPYPPRPAPVSGKAENTKKTGKAATRDEGRKSKV